MSYGWVNPAAGPGAGVSAFVIDGTLCLRVPTADVGIAWDRGPIRVRHGAARTAAGLRLRVRRTRFVALEQPSLEGL